jgi:UDP-glucose 4-epimerase/GDP-4-dehydro-6-deoxy-D-mannose reductase
MTIFATGTTGTIGRHLASRVKSLDIDLATIVFQLESSVILDSDSLLHLAGIVGPAKVEENLELSYQVNVSAVGRLGKQFIESRGSKFVFVSTSHVYEPSDDPILETHQIGPRSTYARQKREAEVALLDIFSKEPERLCIVRVFSVLDWDVAPFTLGGGIAKLGDANSKYVLNNCDDIRDFLTPRTIANALVEICENSALSGEVNLCSGQGITVGQAALEMLGPEAGSAALDRMNSGNSDNPVLVGENSKLRSALPNLDLRWLPSIRT